MQAPYLSAPPIHYEVYVWTYNQSIVKIVGELNSGLPSTVVKDFSIETHRNNICTSQVTVTSSGRTVKRTSVQQLDDDPNLATFRTVVYEDELDLLAVVVTDGADGEGRAQVQLHDNQSGQLLKTVKLLEAWDETNQHDLVFDKDTIVHIVQRKTRVCCYVYKLNIGK